MQIRVFGSSEIIISILRGKSYWIYVNACTAYMCVYMNAYKSMNTHTFHYILELFYYLSLDFIDISPYVGKKNLNTKSKVY